MASILSASDFQRLIKESEIRLTPASGQSLGEDLAEAFYTCHKRSMRIWCGIIDAMTPGERDDPSIVLEPSRASRIALGTGTDAATVEECISAWLDHDGFSAWRMPDGWRSLLDYAPASQFPTEVCEATHASLLVGTCPWCGSAIIPKATDDAILRHAGGSSSPDCR